MAGLLGETKLTKQVRIISTDETGKWWVRVEILKGRRSFLPSFEELFYIIRMIAEAEDLKYAELHQRGWTEVQDFMWDACQPESTWEELKEKYKL